MGYSELAVSAVALLGLSLANAADLPEGWKLEKKGDPFGARIDATISNAGRPASSVVLSFPAHTVSEPGWFVAISAEVTIPPQGPARLEFTCSDSFDGPTRGFHFAGVRVGGRDLFERDVVGGPTMDDISIDLREVGVAGKTEITFRLEDRKAVSNFPIEVYFAQPRLVTEQGAVDLLPPPVAEDLKPLPPDPAITGPPIMGEDWTRTACILQPWGRTQWEVVANAEERVPWLAEEFGFNAVIMLPPDAHNTITGEQHHITHEQFVEALRHFREAGFRVILYTAIMHCGHAPEWMDGTLEREHPEWSQRGPDGETVNVYGHDWLCPSTGALEYTIEYTRKVVELYQADAVMLDNNEFFYTPSGLTCHCDGCRAAFREYVTARFGDTVFGEPTRDVRVPKERGPLYNLWLHWRNRVWAEANEAFRRDLARTKPGTALLANTQYLYSGPTLATDMQYAHEDAMLSESRGQDLGGMVAKLLLGKAISAGRPVWNYLGSFREDDFMRLRPADEVSMNVSTAFATGARPWVVYYGFVEHPDDEENSEALRRMASTLQWHLANDPEQAGLRPYAPVLSLISHSSRNAKSDALLPSHLRELRRRGIPVRLIEEEYVSAESLSDTEALLIESATCLSERAARVIAEWARNGGDLFGTPKAGAYDEVGRLRKRSTLSTALKIGELTAEPTPVGKGTVRNLAGFATPDALAEALDAHRFRTQPAADVEFLPHTTESGDLMVYVCAEAPLPPDLVVYAREGLSGKAIICSSDAEPRIAPLGR